MKKMWRSGMCFGECEVWGGIWRKLGSSDASPRDVVGKWQLLAAVPAGAQCANAPATKPEQKQHSCP